MLPLRRITTSPKEKNQLVLLQHLIFAGVFRTPRESLDGIVIMDGLHKLMGSRSRRSSEHPSPLDLDRVQRELTAKAEAADNVEFRVILHGLSSILKTARAQAFDARIQKTRDENKPASTVAS